MVKNSNIQNINNKAKCLMDIYKAKNKKPFSGKYLQMPKKISKYKKTYELHS